MPTRYIISKCSKKKRNISLTDHLGEGKLEFHPISLALSTVPRVVDDHWAFSRCEGLSFIWKVALPDQCHLKLVGICDLEINDDNCKKLRLMY